MCYDISCQQSFDSLHRWIDDVSKFAVPNVTKILIGTKADLENRRSVEVVEGEQLCRAHNMIKYLEGKFKEKTTKIIEIFSVSSKSNLNIDILFNELARQLKAQYDIGNLVDNRFDSFRLKYPDTTAITAKWYKCCDYF